MSILLAKSDDSSSPADMDERDRFLQQEDEYLFPRILIGGGAFEDNASNIYRDGTLDYTIRNGSNPPNNKLATIDETTFGTLDDFTMYISGGVDAYGGFEFVNARTQFYFFDFISGVGYDDSAINRDIIEARDLAFPIENDRPIVLDMEHATDGSVSRETVVSDSQFVIDYYSAKYPSNQIMFFRLFPELINGKYFVYRDWWQVRDDPNHPEYAERKAAWDAAVAQFNSAEEQAVLAKCSAISTRNYIPREGRVWEWRQAMQPYNELALSQGLPLYSYVKQHYSDTLSPVSASVMRESLVNSRATSGKWFFGATAAIVWHDDNIPADIADGTDTRNAITQFRSDYANDNPHEPDSTTWTNLASTIGDNDFVDLSMAGEGQAADPSQWTKSPDICDDDTGTDFGYHAELLDEIRELVPYGIVSDAGVFPATTGDWSVVTGHTGSNMDTSAARTRFQLQRECVANFSQRVEVFTPELFPEYKGDALADLSGGQQTYEAREYLNARFRIYHREARLASPGSLFMPKIWFYADQDSERLNATYAQQYMDQLLALCDGLYQKADNATEGDSPTSSDGWVTIAASGFATALGWIATPATKPARRLRHELTYQSLPESFVFCFPEGNGTFGPSQQFTAYQSCFSETGAIYGVGAKSKLDDSDQWLAPGWESFCLEPIDFPEHKVDLAETMIKFDMTNQSTTGWSADVVLNGTTICTFTSSDPLGTGEVVADIVNPLSLPAFSTFDQAGQLFEDPYNPGVTCGARLQIVSLGA